MAVIKDITKYILAGALSILPMDARNYSSVIETPEKKELVEKKPKVFSNMEKKVIVYDPGHGLGNRVKGLNDPGAVNGEMHEKDICWNQAMNLDSISNKNKYSVLFSRDSMDEESHLSSRKKVANKNKADVLVSLHLNDDSDKHNLGKYRGFEVIYGRHKGSRRLAQAISYEMGKIPGAKERRIKKTIGETVLASSRYPSVIVESGFIDNKEDLKYLTASSPYVELAINRGIERYFEKGSVKKINTTRAGVAELVYNPDK